MKPTINLLGMKFGHLEVLGFHGHKPYGSNQNNRAWWKCICDCGKIIVTIASSLQNGHAKSCGCAKGEGNITHGYSKHPLYKRVRGMIGRCTNTKVDSYKHYGGRGIEFRFSSVEEAITWIEKHLGLPKDASLQVDRIDNDGHYEAGNLRWATPKEQVANQRKKASVQTHSYKEMVNEIGRRFAESGMDRIPAFKTAIETLKQGCQ